MTEKISKENKLQLKPGYVLQLAGKDGSGIAALASYAAQMAKWHEVTVK